MQDYSNDTLYHVTQKKKNTLKHSTFYIKGEKSIIK